MAEFKSFAPSCGLRRVDIEGRKTQGCGVATAFLKDLAIQSFRKKIEFPGND